MAEPVIIATWSFGELAVRAGWEILADAGTALDAVEKGANAVELDPTVLSVGYGGLPNAGGVVELDAAIMDGPGHRCGAVAALTGIKTPISVARRVMEQTPHVMLAGQNARMFAIEQGFPDCDLTTPESRRRFRQWRMQHTASGVSHFEGHDTVGVCALDAHGDLAAACTTSGLAWKLPGRVGDSPLIGCGLYVDNEVGAAAATGNGDEMMKCCLTYRVISSMERGLPVQEACVEAIRYLLRKRPNHQSQGASVIAISKEGEVGNAATREGFGHPDRLWISACCRAADVQVEEGVYVDPR